MSKSVKFSPGKVDTLTLRELVEAGFSIEAGYIDPNGDVRARSRPEIIYAARHEVTQTTGTPITIWTDIARSLGVSREMLDRILLLIWANIYSAGDMTSTDRIAIDITSTTRTNIYGVLEDAGLADERYVFKTMLGEDYFVLTADSPEWAATETFSYFLDIQAWLFPEGIGLGAVV